MKLSKMTPEQKRIAIAEACGATLWNNPTTAGPVKLWAFNCPSPSAVFEKMFLCGREDALLPAYLSDLNAMHEAEEKIECTDEYEAELIRVCADNPIWHATAAQRADAFLLAKGRATL